MCKQIIFWSNVGFTNQLLEYIHNCDTVAINCDPIIGKIDAYLDELKKYFMSRLMNNNMTIVEFPLRGEIIIIYV